MKSLPLTRDQRILLDKLGPDWTPERIARHGVLIRHTTGKTYMLPREAALRMQQNLINGARRIAKGAST